MWHSWERVETCTGFWWESLRERNLSEDRGVDGRMGIKMDLRKIGWGMWSGFTWLRIGITGGLLLMR
jgi:hypothetical protein